MICRVTHSSAKLLNDVSLSGRKSRTALYRPIIPSWIKSSLSPPARKYELAFSRTNPVYRRMRSSSACWLPFRAFRTSCRSSSSRWAFCAGFSPGFSAVAVRAAMPVPPCRRRCEICSNGRSCSLSCKSHLEVEGEPSTIVQAIQGVCEKCRMLRTYVRIRRDALRVARWRGKPPLLAAAQPLELLARLRI